jgi:hypothetical protein
MEDLANIVAVMFFAWIGAVVALPLLAWLAPVTWNRTLRIALMLAAAGVAVFLTGALFGVKYAAAAGLAAALLIYVGLRRG